MKILKLIVIFLPILTIYQGCKSTPTEEKVITYNDSEKTDKKIFIIGDSTVHNTKYENGVWVSKGWGDELSKYLKKPKNLQNLAEPGASSKSYKYRNEDLEYDGWFNNWYQTKEIIKNSDINDGGYLLIQFGHNDKPYYYNPDNSIHTNPGAYNSFYNELKKYIEYAKDAKLTPILITPVERMYKEEGSVLYSSHITNFGNYAQTIRDLSKDEDILLLDLQDKSWSKFNNYKNSYELTQTFGYKDGDLVHFSPQGADLIAKMLIELICDLEDTKLCLEFISN